MKKKLGFSVDDCWDGYPREQVTFYPDKNAPHPVGYRSFGGMSGGGYEVMRIGVIEVNECIYNALEALGGYKAQELMKEFFMQGFQEGRLEAL